MDTFVKSQLKKQLEHIEQIAEIKNEDIEKQYYDKYSPIFNLLINFLKKQDILLYGGYAIHEVLNQSIYKPYELPDIDIFSYEAPRIIRNIIRFYKSKKIPIVSAKEALHENTYKIYCQGIQILDITHVSKDEFKVLKRNSIRTSIGIPSVNIELLKYSIHLISSESYDAFRWGKTYERMLKIYETYPVKTKCRFHLPDYYVSIPNELNQFTTHFIQKEELPSFGWDTIGLYLEKNTLYKKMLKSQGVPIRYIMYNGNIDLLSKLFMEKSKLFDVSIVESYPGDLFLPSYIALAYKKEKFLYIFSTKECLSTIQYEKSSLMSIHSIITLFYAMYFSSNSKDLLCVIQLLTSELFKHLLTKNKLFKNFSLSCYGKHQGIITLRREREIRRLKNKNIFKK